MSSVSPWASTIGVPPCALHPAALPPTGCTEGAATGAAAIAGAAGRMATPEGGGGKACERTTGADGTGCKGALALDPIEPVVTGSRIGAACAVLNGLSKGVSVKRIASDEQALTPRASRQTVERRWRRRGVTVPA